MSHRTFIISSLFVLMTSAPLLGQAPLSETSKPEVPKPSAVPDFFGPWREGKNALSGGSGMGMPGMSSGSGMGMSDGGYAGSMSAGMGGEGGWEEKV